MDHNKPPSTLKRLARRVVNTCRRTKVENQQLQSPLGRLPAELRLKIYHLALIDNGSSYPFGDGRVELSDLKRPTLTRTCRLIAREALQYYFRHEKFVFTVMVTRGGAVWDLYDTNTKRWMEKINVWDKPVHNIVFKIAHPHTITVSCMWAHPGMCPPFPFLAVVGETGVQVPFYEKEGYPRRFIDIKPWKIRLQYFASNEPIWKGIDKLLAGRLSLRHVQVVSSSITEMAHLSSWGGKRTLADMHRGRPLDDMAVRELEKKTWDWCTVACECRRKQLAKRDVKVGKRRQAEQSRAGTDEHTLRGFSTAR
ncbi:hypothetical protein PRZ48_011182 [Zasmidium cellare]|uniref:Uncharacterized protein n=1 Tax=Zasmidium cellare TaxID=395010 RepID=A0ABR0EB04_ZASCE|nr:hypothetical protein PRZ48_011182 [Zasmidium cellare]